MAAIGPLLAGQVGPAVIPPPQQPGVGGLLAGVGNRAKDVWSSIGRDPAATAAAQVLALRLLQGGGNWKRNLGQAGMDALQTHQAITSREEGKKAAAAAQAEEKRRYEEERKAKQTEASHRRAQEIISGIYQSAEYKDRQEDMKRDDAARAEQLDIQKKGLEIDRMRAMREGGAGSENERKIVRLTKIIQAKTGVGEDDAWVEAEQYVTRGRPIDTTKMAVSIILNDMKNNASVLTENPASLEEMTKRGVEAAQNIATQLGGQKEEFSAVVARVKERLAAQQAGGNVPEGAQQVAPESSPVVSGETAGGPPAADTSRGPTTRRLPEPGAIAAKDRPGLWDTVVTAANPRGKERARGVELAKEKHGRTALGYDAARGQTRIQVARIGPEFVTLITQYPDGTVESEDIDAADFIGIAERFR